jgi:hypothetical protein
LVLGHGAGMVHALWLGRNATVVEIGTQKDLSNDYMARITHNLWLRHRKVICEAHEDVSVHEGCGVELSNIIQEIIFEHKEAEMKRKLILNELKKVRLLESIAAATGRNNFLTNSEATELSSLLK